MIFLSFIPTQKEHLERLEEIFGRLWPSKTQIKQVSRWEKGSELLWVQSKLGKSRYSFSKLLFFEIAGCCKDTLLVNKGVSVDV